MRARVCSESTQCLFFVILRYLRKVVELHSSSSSSPLQPDEDYHLLCLLLEFQGYIALN
jgi:hypothetical protein